MSAADVYQAALTHLLCWPLSIFSSLGQTTISANPIIYASNFPAPNWESILMKPSGLT